MPRSGMRPTREYLFVQALEDMPPAPGPPGAQAEQDALVLAQVDSVGPDVKGIKAGDTVLTRASTLASALTFNGLKMVVHWDVYAVM